MKIALAQINSLIGDFEGNLRKMLDFTERAKQARADLVVFPELCTAGYPPRDFLEFRDFIDRAQACVDRMAKAADGIAIILGSPSVNPQVEGKDLFNTAFFLAEGQIQQVQHKTLLPTYDIFDEYRYFEPAKEWSVVEFQGKRIALLICEDNWNVGNENPLYTVSPLDELASQQPDLIINISASPFAYAHAPDRIEMMQANVEQYPIPFFLCNQVGAQTEIIFDGGSLVMSPDGDVYDELPYFEEDLRVYDLDAVQSGEGALGERAKDKIQLIHDGLVFGVRQYFEKLGFRKAILGLSGGIDSAVVAVLAARALGPDQVRVLLMPSQFSSDHSVQDARTLAENLGVQYELIPIEPIYDSYTKALEPQLWATPFGLAEENLQARIRGVLLMTMSNKFGNILLNTGNKSEIAVGYSTLYGDMNGGLSVIGDVYKTEVYELARFINKDGEIIPENTLKKAPSAELRHDQKDSDSLPDYTILDQILYLYIEQRQGPQEIVERGYDRDLVNRVLRLVNINEFKRYQTPPVLRVSPKAFGMGRRLPIVAKYLA